MLSEILLTLQNFSVNYGNANRKKGSSKIRSLGPDDQYQPECVKNAKSLAKKNRKEKVEERAADMVSRDFWDKRLQNTTSL